MPKRILPLTEIKIKAASNYSGIQESEFRSQNERAGKEV